MSLPIEVVRAIAVAVERQGGDMDDVHDLVAVWERLHADRGGRLDRLRYDAAPPTCPCADGGVPAATGRCERCGRSLIADRHGASL